VIHRRSIVTGGSEIGSKNTATLGERRPPTGAWRVIKTALLRANRSALNVWLLFAHLTGFHGHAGTR